MKIIKWNIKAWNLQKIALAVLLIGAILVIYFQFDEPLRRYFHGIKPGVQYLGEPVEGLFRAEVAPIVARSAVIQGRYPVDAVVDEQRKTIVPELNGIEVDQEATVELLMKAAKGAQVRPVYRELRPSVCWDHYPSFPAYQGNPRKPAVALMINVAWGGEYLPGMLEVLRNEGATGTFFLTGSWAEENEAMVRRIAAAGYELGNHGYSDGEIFPEMDGWAMARSVRQANEIIFDAAGYYPVYFTPHKGEFNDLALEIVSRQGMRTVLWSLDTVDWKKPGVEAMREKILSHLSPGQIILIHPTADTITFLAETIPLINQEGLKVVSIEELLNPSWLRGGAVTK